MVNDITTRVIDATIINGSHANQRFFIPRIPLTRVTDWRNIHIYVTNHGRYPNDDNVYTKNIVYKEVLDN